MRLPPYPFLFIALSYPLGAQCIVDNPGGSKTNPNRPEDAGVPAPRISPLSPLDRTLPDWMCFTAGYRTRVEDSYLLTRFRFGMLLKPAGWLHVYTETQDADGFFNSPSRTPPYQETWDLRRAYLDIGDMQEGHWALRAGRQDLTFEGGRLIGTSYWRNASRGFDAVQGVTKWNGGSASVFAASPVILGDNGLSHHQPGNNLYGLDAKLNHVVPNTIIEPFLFWHVSPGITAENGTAAHLDEKTVGARISGTVSAWDFEAEAAGQTGHIGADPIRAWAGFAIAGYTFRHLPLRTRLFGESDFASGDRNPTDGVHGTFDQISPNIHDRLGLADQFAWQNLKMLRVGLRVWLRKNWVVASAWQDYWLANRTDGVYNSAGSIVARDRQGRTGSHIGTEWDIQTSYRIDRDLEFGAGIGRFMPGIFLTKSGHGSIYNYPYVLMNYNFF